MTTKIYFNYFLADNSVTFEYENTSLSLPADCFITDFSTMEDDQYVNAEFVEGFEIEILDKMVEDIYYAYSKNQAASRDSWKDIKAGWLSEKNA